MIILIFSLSNCYIYYDIRPVSFRDMLGSAPFLSLLVIMTDHQTPSVHSYLYLYPNENPATTLVSLSLIPQIIILGVDLCLLLSVQRIRLSLLMALHRHHRFSIHCVTLHKVATTWLCSGSFIMFLFPSITVFFGWTTPKIYGRISNHSMHKEISYMFQICNMRYH